MRIEMNFFLSAVVLYFYSLGLFPSMLSSNVLAYAPLTFSKTQTLGKVCKTKMALSRFISSFDQTSDFQYSTGEWPYSDSDFVRIDGSNDSLFYETPRFVTHIDDAAIQSLTTYYQEEMSKFLNEKTATTIGKHPENNAKLDILDLCSSWVSHLPEASHEVRYGRVVGIGLNEQELRENSQLTEYYVKNLNDNPSLADLFDDQSFDIVCNVVSVDYLTQPLPIFQEIHRILRPNGIALISFSNRCFPTKAISMWLREDDIGRLSIVASYFHYAATWSSIEAYDIKIRVEAAPPRPSFTEMITDPSKGFAWLNTAAAIAKINSGDPMYVIKAVK
jgi:SAM-dependent methyltransferase